MSVAPPDKPTPPGTGPVRAADGSAAASVPAPDSAAEGARQPVLPPRPDIETLRAAPQERDQERDLWWGSYAPRTMLPSALVCGLLTVGIAGLGWYLFAFYDWPGDELRYAGYLLCGSLWLFQSIRWAYRVLFFNYRLTTHRLFFAESCLFPPREFIRLTEIATVQREQSRTERLLGVGRVRLSLVADGSDPVILAGIYAPERVVGLVKRAVEKAGVRG